MTRAEFVELAAVAAKRASAKSGLLPGISIAQAALESNFGESQLSRAASNYFGLKAHGKHPVMEFRTTEFDGPREKIVAAKFAAYSSMDECFECRDSQITNGAAYAAAREVKADPEKFTREIAKHWATDPKYAEKVLKIYRENGFDRFDLD
jgi:flagellum-specific peptidoglycan hydrolase FlgJ